MQGIDCTPRGSLVLDIVFSFFPLTEGPPGHILRGKGHNRAGKYNTLY